MSKYLKLSNKILEKREKENKQLELDLKEKEKEEKKKKIARNPNEGMKTSSPLEESEHDMRKEVSMLTQRVERLELYIKNMDLR